MWAVEDFGGRYDCFDEMNVRLQQVLRQKMVQQNSAVVMRFSLEKVGFLDRNELS